MSSGDNMKRATKPADSKIRTSMADQFRGADLDAALMDVEDLMARLQVPFFMLGETAKQMVANEPLSGDGIDVGIRRNQMTDSVLSTINTFQPELQLDGTEDGFTYFWQGIPVRVVYLDPDNDLFKRPTQIMYNAWDYQVANPWKEYLKTL